MIRKILAEFDVADGAFLRKNRGLEMSLTRLERSTNANLTKIDKRMALSGRAVSRFGQIFAGAFSVRAAARYTDNAKRIRNALKAMGQEGQENFDLLFQKSVESLTGFNDMAIGVQRFYKVLSDRQGYEETVNQVTTLNKLLALGGRTQQERASTLLQFSQALNKGNLDGEELKALRENAPIELLDAIAKAAGGTRAEIKELGADGALSVDVMISALQSLEAEAAARFGNVEVTFADAMETFRSGAIVAVEAFDETLGASDAAVGGIQRVGRALGENAEAAEFYAQSLKTVLKYGAVAFVGRNLGGAVTTLRAESAARQKNVVDLQRELTAKKKNAVAARVERAELVRSMAVQRASNGVIAKRRASLNKLISLRRVMASTDTLAANAARAERTALIQRMASERAANGTIKARATNLKRLIRLRDAATASDQAAIGVTNQLAVAQKRLSLVGRSLQRISSFASGTLAFFGGWPGLIFSAASALAIFYSTSQAAAQSLEDIQGALDDLAGKHKSTSADIAKDAKALLELQERLSGAIDAQGDAAQNTAQVEVKAINDRLVKNRELLKSHMLLAKIRLEELREATKAKGASFQQDAGNQIKYGGYISKDRLLELVHGGGGASAFNAAAVAEVQKVIDGKSVADLMQFEKDFVAARIEILQQREELQRREAALLEMDQSMKDAQAAKAGDQTVIDAKRAENEALKALQDEAIKTHAAGITQLEKLGELRAAVVIGLNSSLGGGDDKQAGLFLEALANIDAAIDGTRVRVAGSLDQVRELQGAVRAALEQMRDVPFDENGNARANLEALEQKLQEAIEAGYDLDAVSLDGLIGEVNAATAAADTLGNAMATAARKAAQLQASANSALARTKLKARYGDDRVGLQVALADLEYAKIPNRGDAPDGLIDQLQRKKATYLDTIREIATQENIIRTTSSGGGGGRGGSRNTEAQKVLNDAERVALDLIRQTRTEQERHAEHTREVTEARRMLVSVYGEESDMVRQLDEATKRLDQSGTRTFDTLAKSMADTIKNGGDLGDVIGNLVIKLLEMNGVAAFKALFSGGAGGGLGAFATELFSFAGGGVMSSAGSMPLKAYSGGGVANSPQLALFGEGRLNEAYVPLPDGRSIPVTLDLPQPRQLPLPRMPAGGGGPVTIDASLHIAIDGSGLSSGELMRAMEPRLKKQQEMILGLVGKLANRNPGYLGT